MRLEPRPSPPDDYEQRVRWYAAVLPEGIHLDTFDAWDYSAYCQACYQLGVDPFEEAVVGGPRPY